MHIQHHKLRLIYILFTMFALSSCGGEETISAAGGGSTDGGNTPAGATISITGVVVDGYLKGATAFLDRNDNGVHDAGEPSAITLADGSYALDISQADIDANYPVVVDVPATAIDADTGAAVGKHYVMSAPADSYSVISPMTTMIKNKMDLNPALNKQAAENSVKQDIGLAADSPVDLFADYVAKKADGNPNEQGYARVHQIAQVTAQAVANNMDAVQNAANAAGTSATLNDIISMIVSQVILQLNAITIQVDTAIVSDSTNLGYDPYSTLFDPNAAAFDPYTALTQTSVATIDTTNIANDVTAQQAAATATAQSLQDLVTTPNSIHGFYSWKDSGNALGVSRAFGSWQLTVDSLGKFVDAEKSWNPITSSFSSSVPQDEYSIILTNTGWQLAAHAQTTIVTNADASVTETWTNGFSRNFLSSTVDVSTKNIRQELIALNQRIGKPDGVDRWATAIDHTASFTSGTLLVNGSDVFNQNTYSLDFWNDGQCTVLGTQGNCSNANYWDHTTGCTNPNSNVDPTVLSGILTLNNSSFPCGAAGTLSHKDMWITDASVAVLFAAAATDTSGTVKFYDPSADGGSLNFQNGTQPGVPVAVQDVSTWTRTTIQGQEMIIFDLPASISTENSASKIFFTVQDSFVRKGSYIAQGTTSSWWAFNQTAMADIESNFSKMTYVYDPAKGGGQYGISATQAVNGITTSDVWQIYGTDGQPDVVISYSNTTGAWTNLNPNAIPDPTEGRFVLDTSAVPLNANLGTGSGFVLKLFGTDGLNAYQTDGTIDFALGAAGHDVNIGVTMDDVRGQLISDYLNSGTAALIPATARFSNDIANPAMVYSAPYRSIGDRYKVNFGTDAQNCAVTWVDNTTNCNVSFIPGTATVATALTQLISSPAAPAIISGYSGYSVAVIGLATDIAGSAVWTDNAGVQAAVTQWDIRTVHGVEMLYIPTPAVTSNVWRNDRVGIFFTIIQNVVSGRGDHLASGIDPVTRVANGKMNMDSVASGNQTFNKTAINDISAALGLNPLP